MFIQPKQIALRGANGRLRRYEIRNFTARDAIASMGKERGLTAAFIRECMTPRPTWLITQCNIHSLRTAVQEHITACQPPEEATETTETPGKQDEAKLHEGIASVALAYGQHPDAILDMPLITIVMLAKVSNDKERAQAEWQAKLRGAELGG